MVSSFDLQAWSREGLGRVDRFLDGQVRCGWPPAFEAPLRYPVFGGGKRVRPLLALAAAEAIGRASPERAIPIGAAVELIHTYSLVHDDLPAMDDDDVRRGRPTVHRAFDEATAILVGDALLTEAFSVLAAAPLTAEVRITLVALLAEAAGTRGMVGGQVADIHLGASVTDVELLLRLHRAKTGALIRAACEMGALAGDATDDERRRIRQYGEAVGLAFQLADDVLDADQDEGDDGSPSFVRLLGIEATQARARALADEAVGAVDGLSSPAALIALARFTVDRPI